LPERIGRDFVPGPQVMFVFSNFIEIITDKTKEGKRDLLFITGMQKHANKIQRLILHCKNPEFFDLLECTEHL
jgi:hypothetical protein